MNVAAAAAAAAIVGQAAAIVVLAYRLGAWTGRVTQVLDELRRRDDDQEQRLRAIERPARRAR